MRGFIHRVAATASIGALALGFAACSDTTLTSPQQDLRAPAGLPSAVLTTVNLTSSTANTQLCGFNSGMGAVFPAGPCVPASDPGLGTYNPGWFVPLSTAVWVGPQTNSSQYIVPPGTYLFETTFNVPTGAMTPTLNLSTLADNSVDVYLNGHLVHHQTTADCNSGAPCNWNDGGQFSSTDATATDFIFGAGNLNTLQIYLTDTFIGFPLPPVPPNSGPNLCAKGPQPGAPQQFSNGWVQATCFNPGGLWYSGSVTFTPAPPTSTIWCSPGFWKNQGLNLWVPLQGLFYNTANLPNPWPNDPQTFVGYTFSPKHIGVENPTLLDVISTPNTYGGAATNNVASFISNKLFGTPITANPPENCPTPLPPTLPIIG